MYIKFAKFGKENDNLSWSISEFIDPERRAYLNA